MAMFLSAVAGGILPIATSFNSHSINHAVATPVLAAPASYVAPAYTAAYSYPYSYSYPNSYSYPYYF